MMTHGQKCEFEYCIQTGDTYASVAKTFSLNVHALYDYNRGAATKARDVIKIPCMHGCCGQGCFYTIKRSDTLLRIARRYGMPLPALLAANPYLNPAYYVPGQLIVIPRKRPALPQTRYTLGPGDGLVQVLRKFRMDITTLCALNPGLCPMDVRPGQTVYVRDCGAPKLP